MKITTTTTVKTEVTARRETWSTKANPVKCSNGSEYRSVHAASRDTGVCRRDISDCCKGLKSEVNGLVFAYANAPTVDTLSTEIKVAIHNSSINECNEIINLCNANIARLEAIENHKELAAKRKELADKKLAMSREIKELKAAIAELDKQMDKAYVEFHK